MTVRCFFYIHKRRDSAKVGDSQGHKWKVTSTIKYFTKSLAPFNYRYHLKQHAESGAAYQVPSDQDKKKYFKNKVKCINTLHQHTDLTADSIEFVISANIVNTIIGDIFFRIDKQLLNDSNSDDDTATSKAITNKAAKKSKEKVNAMKLFVKQSDESTYKVTIKNYTFWIGNGPCLNGHVIPADNSSHPASQGLHQDNQVGGNQWPNCHSICLSHGDCSSAKHFRHHRQWICLGNLARWW